MLKLFTEALGEFLTERLTDLPEKPVVSFALPGTVAGQNAVNIFLTSIKEDPDLRSNDLQYKREELGWITTRPPLRLKCTYLISAWPMAADPVIAILDQYQLLSAAFTVIATVKKLPAAFIPAPFSAYDLPEPVIELSDDQLHLDPAFWTALDCAFRPAFSFSATISLPIAGEHFDYGVDKINSEFKIK
ncbi:MAG: DUF4255 domain-containing protein [Clostridiales bacterium]|jgi:hypothetical protein|nr:DUF4255 domain-containing protein [Clostridiales bacterium]MDR2713556.1 DUF4255 domain-containing protein [Clostridiales bacterium]